MFARFVRSLALAVAFLGSSRALGAQDNVRQSTSSEIAVGLAPHWAVMAGLASPGNGVTLVRRVGNGLDVGASVSKFGGDPLVVSPFVRLAGNRDMGGTIGTTYLELARLHAVNRVDERRPSGMRWSLMFGGGMWPVTPGFLFEGGVGAEWTPGTATRGALGMATARVEAGWAWGGPARRYRNRRDD